MKVNAEAEVCTVVEKEPGSYHVLCKTGIWVYGFTTSRRPTERTVVRLEGERPDGEAPIDVYATVMANKALQIAPRMKDRYKYAELTESDWVATGKNPAELWKEQRAKAKPKPTLNLGPLPMKPPGRL